MYTAHPITIVLVNDEHFMPMAAALLKSIQVNHHSGEAIEVYMVSDGISKTSKKKLEKSVVSDSFSIVWIDISKAIPSDVKLLTKPPSLLRCMPDTSWRIIYLKTEKERCF
jgi:lipopolysaccharide biosynthesis glycosyltransferase